MWVVPCYGLGAHTEKSGGKRKPASCSISFLRFLAIMKGPAPSPTFPFCHDSLSPQKLSQNVSSLFRLHWPSVLSLLPKKLRHKVTQTDHHNGSLDLSSNFFLLSSHSAVTLHRAVEIQTAILNRQLASFPLYFLSSWTHTHLCVPCALQMEARGFPACDHTAL